MRKLIASMLAVFTMSFGVPASVVAQSIGSISGEVVDAGGRAAAGQRVELVLSGATIRSTTTGSRGEYVFASVPSGDYVVRVVSNKTQAGVRVSLAPGQTVGGQTIVLPSAAAPSGAILALPALWIGVAAAAAIAGTVIALKDSEDGSS